MTGAKAVGPSRSKIAVYGGESGVLAAHVLGMSAAMRNRVRAGSAAGCRFTPAGRSQSVVTLDWSDIVAPPVPAQHRRAWRQPADDGYEPPTEMPSSAILHTVSYTHDRDGNVDAVFCTRCGADAEGYDPNDAVESGADPCEDPA